MHRLYIATPPGLESVCRDEVEALGLPATVAGTGGVDTSGSLEALLRANLALRTASRVLLRLTGGPASAWQRELERIDLRSYLAPRTTVAVEVAGAGSAPARFRAPLERLVARQVPDASVVTGPAAQTLHVRVHRGRATLSLDASGEHLHRRGYRVETGAAPLRENLAAGVLALAGWREDMPLLDPMCGSGTFLIEAALWAGDRAPGMERRFACEDWPCVPAVLSDSARAYLRGRERARPPAPIVGSDLRAGALGVARRNATRAGVLPWLRLERADARKLEPPGTPPGLVVANPPYGRRVGEREELAALYQGLGASLRARFSGWRVAILLMDRRLGQRLGLAGAKEIPLRNGGLPCTLLLADIP